jgi:hypothetical protein
MHELHQDMHKTSKHVVWVDEKGSINLLGILACQEMFVKLKRCLVEAPIVSRPNFAKPFILDVD